jgi:hypothetical protein
MPRRNERHRRIAPDLDTVMPIVRLRRNRLVVRAHDRIVAERGDDLRAVRGCKPRQRRRVEMIGVGMRD